MPQSEAWALCEQWMFTRSAFSGEAMQAATTARTTRPTCAAASHQSCVFTHDIAPRREYPTVNIEGLDHAEVVAGLFNALDESRKALLPIVVVDPDYVREKHSSYRASRPFERRCCGSLLSPQFL